MHPNGAKAWMLYDDEITDLLKILREYQSAGAGEYIEQLEELQRQ